MVETEQQLVDKVAEEEQAQEFEEEAQLAEQQESYKNSQTAVSDIPQPSYFIDGIQTTIGFINDAVDAAELTGVLAILSLFVSYFLSGLNWLIAFLSGNNIKHTRAGSNLKQKQIIKLVVGGVFEMIPGWSIGPWSLIFNIWSWVNKIQAHKAARREALAEAASKEVIGVV